MPRLRSVISYAPAASRSLPPAPTLTTENAPGLAVIVAPAATFRLEPPGAAVAGAGSAGSATKEPTRPCQPRLPPIRWLVSTPPTTEPQSSRTESPMRLWVDWTQTPFSTAMLAPP